MKSNILINCLVLFYNVGIFPSDILTLFIFIDLHACSEVFATEPCAFQNFNIFSDENAITPLFFKN